MNSEVSDENRSSDLSKNNDDKFGDFASSSGENKEKRNLDDLFSRFVYKKKNDENIQTKVVYNQVSQRKVKAKSPKRCKEAAVVQVRKVSPYFSKGCKEAVETTNVKRRTSPYFQTVSEEQKDLHQYCKVKKVSRFFNKAQQPPPPPPESPRPKRVRRTPVKSPILSSSQKKDDAYLRKTSDNTWVPPKSPCKLLQEDHWHDPWRVLVICMLLNVTCGSQTRRVISDFFALCPDAKTATQVEENEIENLIKPLGIHKKRAKMIKRLSLEYLQDSWTHVTQLHGVGKYAADAYAIFCNGKWDYVETHDHMLNYYWDYLWIRCKYRS